MVGPGGPSKDMEEIPGGVVGGHVTDDEEAGRKGGERKTGNLGPAQAPTHAPSGGVAGGDKTQDKRDEEGQPL